MKWVVFLCILLLACSSALAVYEDVLEEPVELVDGAQLFIQAPDVVYEGSDFTLIMVPQEIEQGLEWDVELSRNGEVVERQLLVENVSGEETLVVLWEDNLQESADYVLEYTATDKESTTIEFSIAVQEKVIVDRLLEERVSIPGDITENQKEYLITLLTDAGYDYSLGQFLAYEELADAQVSFNKKVYGETLVYSDNSTTQHTVVVIDIKTDETILDLKIIETIPKDFASHVDQISFSEEPIILEEDPVIMWHLQGVDEKRLQYSVEGNTTVTGNTILLVEEGEEESSTTTSSPLPSKDIWLPVLLIPLIALTIIFFSKFAPKKK